MKKLLLAFIVGVIFIFNTNTTYATTITEDDFIYEPDIPSGFQQDSAKTNSIKVKWDEVEGATGYQIGFLDGNNKWHYYGGPSSNKITDTKYTIKSKYENNECILDIITAQSYTFYIRSYVIHGQNEKGKNIVTYSEMSEPIVCYTAPDNVIKLKMESYTSKSISLSWNPVFNATGYVIKRKQGKGDYKVVDTISDTVYTDKKLSTSKTYSYKVAAYNVNTDITSDFTSALKVTTCPSNPVVKAKAGDERIRLTWKKVSGASGYKIYEKNNGNYDCIKTISSTKCLLSDLTNGKNYNLKIVAYKALNSKDYISSGAFRTEKPKDVGKTDDTPKFYTNKSKFESSKAYKELSWFKKNVDYDKSYVIPGSSNTNVAGFKSTNMCPQGITFAGDYLLISAYDRKEEENSVIYIKDGKSGDLLTTLVLPDKIHIGGLAYDGKNIWFSHGTKVGYLKYNTIKKAAKEGKEYKNINYKHFIQVHTTASFMTYYKGMLWVGKNAEKGSQPLYCYTVKNKAKTPSLTTLGSIKIPDRTQGITFLPDNSLILSRSNLASSKRTYYIAKLEQYRPKWGKNTIKKLGGVKKSIAMPSMNEGVIYKSKHIYVLYESPAFDYSVYPMDRTCAFTTKTLEKKKSTKKSTKTSNKVKNIDENDITILPTSPSSTLKR